MKSSGRRLIHRIIDAFYFFFPLFLLLNSAPGASAAKISGIIRDESNQPLPYVIVYVSGTSIGTTANNDGYYTLELQKGDYDVSFRMIGFTQVTKHVTVGEEAISLNVQLTGESVKLAEVTIRAGAEDPAYAIIREAQNKRKYYRDQVKTYSADAYVKSTQKLNSYPKKIFGQALEMSDIMDTTTKIFYLSESVSELFFRQPDKVKERMISSKVSGSPRTYSFNQAANVLIGFYENIVNISGLTPRGIVSPIAGNSFFYYKFRLEGTFVENGVTVNKISVIPKRNTDPVFRGTIYIAEDTWRIYSLDLFITQEQQIEFIDTFRIKQNFIRVSEETWLPFSHQFDFSFSAFGFKGDGIVLGVFSNYNLTRDLPSSFFDGAIMKVDDTANKKDSVYWEKVRPVPLTSIEVVDYHRRDSSLAVKESKIYLDTTDAKANKFKFGNVFTGYSWRNSYEDKRIDINSPLQDINFNTVEGWNAEMAFTYRYGFGKEDRRRYSIAPALRYGFSNSHFNGHVKFEYLYNTRRRSILILDGGTQLLQFNPNNPITEMVNGIYSLMAEKNYIKFYEKQYFLAEHRMEVFNGLRLNLGAEYASRNSLPNASDYSFVNVDNREYTSNDPFNESTDLMRFETHEVFIFRAGLDITINQLYIDRPEGKFNVGSDWPVFHIAYKKGVNDVEFDAFRLSVDDELGLGLFGNLKYKAVYGDFISKKKLYSPDLRHFNGNKTWFSAFRLDDFKNLEYYDYSTADEYVEVHAEENFGGFILNKIPLIRKLKLQEIAGFHFLHTSSLDQYFEFSLGVEKLGFLRAELFTSWKEGQKGTIGFLIGLKTSIGN